MAKILKIIKSTILCLRFPFLYPRNRFTDKHYNNWKLLDKIRDIRNQASPKFNVTQKEITKCIDEVDDKSQHYYTYISSKKFVTKTNVYGNQIEVKLNGGYIVLKCGNRVKKIPLAEFGLDSSKIVDVSFIEQEVQRGVKPHIETFRTWSICLMVEDGYDIKPQFKIVDFVISPLKLFYANFLSFWHDNILQIVHGMTSYTELNAMPQGWRKKFGIQMCKEIRAELLKHGLKYLFKYRIEQIKEKFGTLRWYDNFVPSKSQIPQIISKYEDISYNTCIVCGKEAKWMSKGWISPYCDNCIGDTTKATKLK
jgi:hypothetical protein